ncbi:hypothetical protein ACFSTH_11600 [Paenibacillus yanchengensis]|uniref:Sulfatase-modifying factor enzyme domain-containing protein n=1 Tax=Paenibacillus yanchengensis TaxID=2035833 RepID=A0ABW4YJC5_9BACL
MIIDQAFWNEQTSIHKEQLLHQLITRLPAGFTFLRMERFERFGIQLETGVFSYKGCEFVYIPGNRVTLGWESWAEGLDAATQEDFENGLSELDQNAENLELLLRQQMSPVREADIGPLLIERRTHSVAWYEVRLADLDPEEDDDILEELERFKTSSYRTYELHHSFQIEKKDGRIRIWLFDNSADLQDWTKDALPKGFDLLTEDEWEYVYGGGCRTLFPWGDSFDYSMNVRHFGELDQDQEEQIQSTADDRSFDLETSSGTGLHFLGDPYKSELTVSPEGLVRGKGGDGGSLICGGMGVVWGYLPVSTYYRDPYEEELDWEDRSEYLHYRRIVRL